MFSYNMICFLNNFFLKKIVYWKKHRALVLDFSSYLCFFLFGLWHKIYGAKILIGCDGASSVMAEFLKLKPKKLFPAYAMRGLTYYPSNSHDFAHEFVRTYGNNIVCGRIPINQNLVYWFVLIPGYPQGTYNLQNLGNSNKS